MSGPSPRLSSPLSQVVARVVGIVAVLVVVGLMAVFVWGVNEALREVPPSAAALPTPVPVEAADVQSAFDRGLVALAAGHRREWKAAVPTRGRTAQAAVDDLFDKLSPLPLGDLHAVVTPIPANAGVFKIVFTGRIGGAGPGDRLLAERELLFKREGGGAVAVADRSPALTKRQYLMAFSRPRAIVQDKAVVVYDASWRELAQKLADAMPSARADVASTLGTASGKPILVVVFTSPRQVADYLGRYQTEKRIRFFTRLSTRLAAAPYVPGEVGVLGTELNANDPWLPHMLAHEVTHALTMDWFFKSKHSPPLLEEGLATAVEDGRSYQPLRDEIAAGNKRLPLIETFANGDFWGTPDYDVTRLAYLEGGSLVKYVLSRWSLATFRRFSRHVADSDLKEATIKRLVRRDLGVTWDEFYAGWKDYVQTLP